VYSESSSEGLHRCIIGEYFMAHFGEEAIASNSSCILFECHDLSISDVLPVIYYAPSQALCIRLGMSPIGLTAEGKATFRMFGTLYRFRAEMRI
jgi:hypothetical protein